MADRARSPGLYRGREDRGHRKFNCAATVEILRSLARRGTNRLKCLAGLGAKYCFDPYAAVINGIEKFAWRIEPPNLGNRRSTNIQETGFAQRSVALGRIAESEE